MEKNGGLTYKPKEAAKAVGVSLPVMYDLCRRADFPAVRIGRAIVIPKASLEQWLVSQASGRPSSEEVG